MHSNVSTFIGDAAQIGLQCGSGNITDCNESLFNHQNSAETPPNGCEKKLIFGQNAGLCGNYCDSNTDKTTSARRSQSTFVRSGWTIYTRFEY